MLRGINVGGHHKIKMDALRSLYGSLGLQNAQSYIQSGNVVFRSAERDLVQISRQIENEIEQTFTFRPSVILRTPSELRNAIAKNPFAERAGIDGSKLLVNFLTSDPGVAAREKVGQVKTAPEELHIEGRELYMYFPNGQGQSKLPVAAIDRILKTPGTARNWNTVTKLLEMAEKLEAAFPN